MSIKQLSPSLFLLKMYVNVYIHTCAHTYTYIITYLKMFSLDSYSKILYVAYNRIQKRPYFITFILLFPLCLFCNMQRVQLLWASEAPLPFLMPLVQLFYFFVNTSLTPPFFKIFPWQEKIMNRLLVFWVKL